MSKEHTPQIPLSGARLKESVTEIMKQRLQAVDENPGTAFNRAVLNNLDVFGINWNPPRTTGEISGFFASLGVTIHYAYLRSGKDLPYSDTLTYETSENMINTVVSDPNMKEIFDANLWRQPITFLPKRTLAPRYILNHHFGDLPINVIDLGAGLNNTLPQLATEIAPPSFSNQDQMGHLESPVNIALGVGVDKQEQDKLWVKANTFGMADFDEQADRAMLADKNRFPFVVADLLQTQQSKQTIHAKTNNTLFDSAISSFLRHQLGKDPSIQWNFKQLLLHVLKDNGIWIDVGEELLHEAKDLKNYSVNVYQKKGDTITLIGSPFKIKETGEIQHVNLDYFNSSGK